MSGWQKERQDDESFSNFWLVVSIVLFCAVELVIGGFVGSVVVGKYVSQMFHYKIQVMLNLGSYLVGGVVIGVISPGVRIVEPAVGAAVSVAMVLSISIFLPNRWLHFSMNKLLVGGGIAFVIALLGARFGEKLMGNVR